MTDLKKMIENKNYIQKLITHFYELDQNLENTIIRVNYN